MSVDPSPYPNLRGLYRERIETVKERHFEYLLISAAIAIGGFIIGDTRSLQGALLLAAASLATIYFALRMISLGKGGDDFDSIWQDKISEIKEITSTERLALLNEVEHELADDRIYFTDVGLTKCFMLLFREFGSFYRVKDITSVYVHEFASRTERYGLYDAKSYYVMGCSFVDLRDATLTNDEQEMREIFYEIRLRHPEVALTRGAHDYFFPPSVLVE